MYYNTLTKDIKVSPKTEVFEDDDYKVFWEGLLFIKGFSPGEESLQQFVEALKRDPIEKHLEKLSGVYSCFMHDKKSDNIYSFVGNSGLCNMFHSPNIISTSFLKLVELSDLRKTDINPNRYSDLVAAESFMKWETYFDEVNRVRLDEVIVDNGSELKAIKKDLVDIFKIKKYDKSIIEQYKILTESLKKFNGRISCDLSGGLDTRMNCVSFNHHGLEFETAISGTPGCLDVEFSTKVAEILGTNHYITYHTVNTNMLEKEIEECFEVFEPLQNVVVYHRYLQFQKDKQKRNNKLTITGHAGELYKSELIWNLDNSNPEKAIDQLLSWGANLRYGTDLRHIPHEIYTEKYRKFSNEYGHRLHKFLMNEFGEDTSGKVGAKIYTYFHEASRSAPYGAVINRFSPLLDRDFMPCGITLKTTMRTTKGNIVRLLTQPWDDREVFEARVITALNKKAAKVKITHSLGVNASTKKIDRIKKLYKIARSKIKRPRFINISPIHPEFFDAVRNLNKTQEMFEILKNEGIIKRKITPDNIGDNYIGSLYTIGRFIEFCDSIN